jgi:2-polyprenyl-3-methyl-5-hydroxy-6-metoxy-1,4-benzoquinol methylase
MTDHYRSSFDVDTPNHPHAAAVRFVGEDLDVLEIGCWSGHVTEVLARRGNRVVGVDVDGEQLAANAFLRRSHLVDLDLVALSTIEDDRFDVIVLGDVLEHLRDPRAVLADLVTLLRPDGRLVVSVPNVAHVDIRLHLLAGRWEYQESGLLDRTHLRWFTRASLRELLTSVGFVATRLEPVLQPVGASGLVLDGDRYPEDALRYVRADPDAEIYQFVVEARPVAAGDTADDALAPRPRAPVDFAAEARARDEEIAALRNEVTAWRNSRVVRFTAPLRTMRGALRRGRKSSS